MSVNELRKIMIWHTCHIQTNVGGSWAPRI